MRLEKGINEDQWPNNVKQKKSNMIYQIDGVIIKQFISRQLGGIWIAQLVGQWLAVQLLTLRQTVVESLVQNGHNLKITNGQKKFNDPAKKRCFPPFLFFTCLTECEGWSLSACNSSLDKLRADESNWRARMYKTNCSALRWASECAGLMAPSPNWIKCYKFKQIDAIPNYQHTGRWRGHGVFAGVDRLVESSSKWRGSITSHVHNALNQSQDKVEFSQRVVVLFLLKCKEIYEYVDRAWKPKDVVYTSKRVSCVSSGAVKTMGPSIGGEVP